MTCSFVPYRPSAAVIESVRVVVDDLIVVATDGLFNNLYNSDISTLLENFKVMYTAVIIM